MLSGRSELSGTDWPAGVRYQPLGRRVRSWLRPEVESEWTTPGSAGDWAARRDDKRKMAVDISRIFLMRNKGRAAILIERY
jgi:hypothetical protein